jgi:hypothetical protein
MAKLTEDSNSTAGVKARCVSVACDGAGGRTRTDMSVTSPDFESGAYTNFATPASRWEIIRPVALGRNRVGALKEIV